ncbi:hypothetical protein AB0939_15870 [Streptomyces sp. NPDC006990]|uniref:hypothetical protein n=1 Tax=Streptomyces sp. NPDC006990 TaxID=3154481 RepID=UPI003453AA31
MHGRVIRIGREASRCLLARRSVTFHRTKTWKEPPDPERDAKLTASLHAYLRWRNANARHRDVLAGERKERARIRSGKRDPLGQTPPRHRSLNDPTNLRGHSSTGEQRLTGQANRS